MINADISAERAVLAGLFAYGAEGYGDVADIVQVNTFTNEINQALFKCFEKLLKDDPDARVDLPSLYSAASDLKYDFLEKTQAQNMIRAITNFPIEAGNLRKMAGKIRKLQIGRLLDAQLDEAKCELSAITGDESIDHILSIVENKVLDFSSLLVDSQNDGPVRMSDGLQQYIEYLAANQREMVGISSGFKKYDMAIGGGFRRKTVNLVGARPKIGKTTFAMNVAKFVAGVLGYPVLVLDTEMSREDQWTRLVANTSGVPISEIETGRFAKKPIFSENVKKALAEIEGWPYHYINIAGKPFEEVLSLIRRWLIKNVGFERSGEAKPCLIIYDYLKLMDTSAMTKANIQEYQALGFQMTGLHNFMVRYSVPCLAFIQLNRDGIQKEDTDVASGSDRLIWLCSNFTIFKMKTDEEIAEDSAQGKQSYNRKLVPIVERHGGGLEPGDYINMNMYGAFARIVEGKTRNEMYEIKAKQTDGFTINGTNDQPEVF